MPAAPEPADEVQARIIGELILPAYLHRSLGIAQVSGEGVRTFIEQFMTDAGKPTDPVERLVLQQLVFLHFRLARLHSHASDAESLEAIKVLNGAAARLIGEMRRLVLALKTYRAPVTSKAVTFVKMQAVAERQDVRFVDRGGPDEERIVNQRPAGVEGGGPEEPGYGRLGQLIQEPAPSGCRPEAATVDG